MKRLLETSISQAVKLAFPELEPRAAKIIAGWYEAEDAAEDFESTADLADMIESDITEMVWAATDPEEIAIVKAGLINGGFVDADSLPEEEDSDESKASAQSTPGEYDPVTGCIVAMAQNYKEDDGYSDVHALEAALGVYERSTGRNIGYNTLEKVYQALEARGFSFPEEELEEAATRGGTKVKESRSTGGKYAAGGRALQDDYYDIIEDVIAGWDVSGMTSGNMLPLDQIKAALQNYDSGLTPEDIHDIIDTYFDYSSESAAASEPTIGELEAEAQELAIEGWPEEDVNHRLAKKHGMDKDTIEKIRAYESSEKITWSSFDTPESNALEEKYLPDHGDGDNMASQAVTAATKLIYKWFNDGDVYDNSYGLSGWANDISGSANWLAKHVPGARDILWRIQKTHSEEEYVSNILWPLFNLVYDAKLLSSLEKKPKVDDAYSCKGPFEFSYEDEDAYQEEDPESFGDYDQDYELDESTGKKAKLVRKQEHRYYASSNDRLTVLYIDGKPVTKEYDVIVPEGTKYANTRGSERMPLSGSEIEEEAVKLLRRYNSGFSMAVEEFKFRSGYGYILRVLRNEDLPEPATARELYDHENMSELWDTPEEYFAHEGREDLVELARSEAAHQEEDLEESMKTSIDRLLREAAKPVGRDRLGDWYNRSFRERNSVAGKPKMKEALDNDALFEEGSVANSVRESHDRPRYGDGLHWNSRAADDMLLTVLREIYENANIELPVTIRALVPAELKKSIKFLDRILDLYV